MSPPESGTNASREVRRFAVLQRIALPVRLLAILVVALALVALGVIR